MRLGQLLNWVEVLQVVQGQSYLPEVTEEQALERVVQVEEALEALEALEEMGANEDKRKGFANGILALKNASSQADRLVILGSLWRENKYFARQYLKELLSTEQKAAALFLEQNMSDVFLDVLWPDFGGEHLRAALDEYGARERRYGR